MTKPKPGRSKARPKRGANKAAEAAVNDAGVGETPAGPSGEPHPNSKFARKPDLLNAAMKQWGVSRAEAFGIERTRLDLEDMGVPRDRLDAMFRDPQWVKAPYADKMRPMTQLRANVEPPAPAPTPAPSSPSTSPPAGGSVAPDAATVARMAKVAAVRAEYPNMSKKTLAAWEKGENLETLEATYAGISRDRGAAAGGETNVAADPAKRPPSGEANNLPEPQMGRAGKPVSMVPMDESVVMPNRTPVTQADVIGVGGDGNLPQTRTGELPEAVTPTPALADLMPGLTAPPGARKGMAFEPATRDKMWAAYSGGSVEIEGKKNKVLAAAKKKGIAADDRAAFDSFLDNIQTKSKPKPAAPGDVQMPAGVELQMVDPGSPDAPQARTEAFVGADGRRPFAEGTSLKPGESAPPKTKEPDKPADPPPQSKAVKPWSSDPQSPFYNVEKPWFVSAAQGTGRGLAAGAKYAAKTWPGMAAATALGAGAWYGTMPLIRYLTSQRGSPPQQAGPDGKPMPPMPSMPTDMPTYSPMQQFNVDGIRAALERKRPTDMPMQQGGQ